MPPTYVTEESGTISPLSNNLFPWRELSLRCLSLSFGGIRAQSLNYPALIPEEAHPQTCNNKSRQFRFMVTIIVKFYISLFITQVVPHPHSSPNILLPKCTNGKVKAEKDKKKKNTRREKSVYREIH